MRLEVLLLDRRGEDELQRDLAALAAFPEVAVQVWVDSRDAGLRARLAERLAGDGRTLLFAHPGVNRGHRIVHAATQARGDLLLALPRGRTLDRRGLAEVASLSPADGPRFIAAPAAPAARPSGGRFGLAELLAMLQSGAVVAVAPAAIIELEAAHRGATPPVVWKACAAVEYAAYFAARSNEREWALVAPLALSAAGREVDVDEDPERLAAWQLLVLAALSLGVDHADPSPPGLQHRAVRHERLGDALVEAVRALSAARNPSLNAGLLPTWSAAPALAGSVR